MTCGRTGGGRVESDRVGVHRYYDPATGTFLSVDPLVGMTGDPYGYAGGDPSNVTDPLGLFGWNPIADVAQLGHAEMGVLDAARHDAAAAGDWVGNHPKLAIGIGLGVLALATGGAGLVALGVGAELAGGAGLALGLGSVAAGAGAAALDYPACFDASGDSENRTLACMGFGFGVAGAVLGGAALAIPVFAVQFATIGTFSGIAGLGFDIYGSTRTQCPGRP